MEAEQQEPPSRKDLRKRSAISLAPRGVRRADALTGATHQSCRCGRCSPKRAEDFGRPNGFFRNTHAFFRNMDENTWEFKGRGHRRTNRSRGSLVSTRKPRAPCCARQPCSMASTIASSGRSCTTPSTSSEHAAPANSTRRNATPPYSDDDHIMHQTGVHDAIHSRQNALRRTSRAAAYPVDCGKRPIPATRLMQFLRVPVVTGCFHGDQRDPLFD